MHCYSKFLTQNQNGIFVQISVDIGHNSQFHQCHYYVGNGNSHLLTISRHGYWNVDNFRSIRNFNDGFFYFHFLNFLLLVFFLYFLLKGLFTIMIGILPVSALASSAVHSSSVISVSVPILIFFLGFPLRVLSFAHRSSHIHGISLEVSFSSVRSSLTIATFSVPAGSISRIAVLILSSVPIFFFSAVISGILVRLVFNFLT